MCRWHDSNDAVVTFIRSFFAGRVRMRVVNRGCQVKCVNFRKNWERETSLIVKVDEIFHSGYCGVPH